MHCIIVTNKWTGHKYLYPEIYTDRFIAEKAIESQTAQLGVNNTLEIAEVIPATVLISPIDTQ